MLVPLPGAPRVQHTELGSGVEPEATPAPPLRLTRRTLFLRHELIMDYLDCPVQTLSRRKETVTAARGKQRAIVLLGTASSWP